jgi:hypothetical protein
MLVERQGIEEFFNSSDQGVKNYSYDITLLNNGSYAELEKLCKDFSILLTEWDTSNRILV